MDRQSTSSCDRKTWASRNGLAAFFRSAGCRRCSAISVMCCRVARRVADDPARRIVGDAPPPADADALYGGRGAREYRRRSADVPARGPTASPPVSRAAITAITGDIGTILGA